MTENIKKVNVDKIRRLATEILKKSGLSERDASTIVDCMIEADLTGVSTHGLGILKSHVKRILNKGYNLSPIYKEITTSPSFKVIDADNSIGFLSGVHSIKLAISGAKEQGVYTIFTKNANTYGPAFYYPYLAAKQGFIGMTFSNSPSAMAPWGGSEKLLGTNPFSISIPGKNMNPIIFDMSTSIVAKSKINQAKNNNERIPEGWALDKNGMPTTDPTEAIQGLVLPMAEHKGYGLALTIDILAGVLSGASYLNNVGRFYSPDSKAMNVGQVFIAIDPVKVLNKEFYNKMDAYAEEIRNSVSLTEEKVRLPGDMKYINKKNNLKNGIPLSKNTVEDINQCLEKLNIEERI